MTRTIIYIALLNLFAVTASAAGPGRYQPVVAGEWRVLYAPVEAGPRVNDHTVFMDGTGEWRFVGIAAHQGLDLLSSFLGHASGPTLEEPLTELPVLFRDYPDRRPKWAPHVIVHEGRWHLFCGPGRIRHYVSADGIDWTFHSIAIYPGWFPFRDTMVIRIGDDGFLMYCTNINDTISAYQSDDLYQWKFASTAFQAIKPATAYPRWFNISATESPFVVHIEGAYYLSVSLVSPFDKSTYAQTIVVRSEDPLNFGVYAAGGTGDTAELVTVLNAHAAEYIQTPDGQWFITTCGWKTYPGLGGMVPGAVAIAPLKWEAAK